MGGAGGPGELDVWLSGHPSSLLSFRFAYLTPKSYLEMISLYKKLLANKLRDINERQQRLETGVSRLIQASADVAGLQEQLTSKQVGNALFHCYRAMHVAEVWEQGRGWGNGTKSQAICRLGYCLRLPESQYTFHSRPQHLSYRIIL